jgi:hypothetical protein
MTSAVRTPACCTVDFGRDLMCVELVVPSAEPAE